MIFIDHSDSSAINLPCFELLENSTHVRAHTYMSVSVCTYVDSSLVPVFVAFSSALSSLSDTHTTSAGTIDPILQIVQPLTFPYVGP